MREIVFDTETTGFEPGEGHRIVEIGCVELMDHFPTGNTLQFYLNPERDVPVESVRVHGLTGEFLADKPLFADIAGDFLDFLGDAPLVIHNASFDIKFINAELQRVGKGPIPLARAIDTIEIAKRKIPGARYSLDELCKRFGVDLTARTKHGALLDAQLTAEIYLELRKGGTDSGACACRTGRTEMRLTPAVSARFSVRVTRRSLLSTMSPSRFAKTSSSRCSARRAVARRRCSD